MKNLAFVILSLLFVQNSYSQDFKKFRFGLKGVPNISWMKPDATNLESDRPGLRFGYGLMTEFALSDNYYFATGVEVITAGGSMNYLDSAYYITTSNPADTFRVGRRNYNLQYLNIPLTLKMRTNEIGYMRYFGQFGLDIGFRTKATSRDRDLTGTFRDSDITKDAQLFRVAMNLGIGAEYTLIGNTALVVSVNYNNGFTNALRRESRDLMANPWATGADDKELKQNRRHVQQKATSNFVALNVGILF
jgi:hypothetical protein